MTGNAERGQMLRPRANPTLQRCQVATQVDLKRYEDGLRIAMTVLAERDEQAG
jgi:hypothetical protein